MMKTIDKLFIENIKKWEKGKCFICGNPCLEDYFCHEACSIAYDDEKKKRLKEAWEKAEQQSA